MIIAVDARDLSNKELRGIGNYLLTMLQALLVAKPAWRFILLSNRPLNIFVQQILSQYKNVEIKIKQPLITIKSSIWALLYLPKIISSTHADFFWEPAPFYPLKCKIRLIVTVHDVVHKEFYHTMKLTSKIYYKIFADRAINRADKLWANSNYTKYMIDKYYPKRKCKDIVVGCSINMKFYKKIEIDKQEKVRLLEKIKIQQELKLLLFVGTLEPRKNLKYLLSLMPSLAKRGYQLIVVGGNGWGKTEIADIVNAKEYPRKNVCFPGYLTNEELLFLYNIADCYVSTSLNEGFGSPQLEAIACGIPVVTANNSAMSEVVGGAGILIDGWEKDKWINGIEYAINNKDELVSHYAKKVKDYNPDLIAERIINYIEN
jgi:glycosyltransferase involved in cell wall biosynthesis